jgi:hypothetical protein
MARIYILGIVFLLMALNIPEVTGDIRNTVTFYSPRINDQLLVAKDTAEPVLLSILKDIQQKSKITLSSNGVIQRTIALREGVDTSDTFSLSHAPSITAEQFDTILRDYNSPAAGVGIPITAYAKEKQIDTAYVLYMFIQESTAGTSPNWNAATRNPGNIICAGYSTCIGRFRQYSTWEEGFKAQIDLLADYRDTNNIQDIDTAMHKWAPPSENDTAAYIDTLKQHVDTWRKANAGNFIATSQPGGDQQITSRPALRMKGSAVSSLSLGGCLADTVPSALLPSPGLQDIAIDPGESWSFNENWHIVDVNNHYCSGVVYGGVCDMATRYHLAAKQLGLETQYQRHPGGLNDVAPDDAVVIWSGGVRGGQDLYIVNTTDKTAIMRAEITSGEFIVTAYFI